MKKWLALLKHPTGVVVAIGLIILATEFLIMALIDFHQATILKDLSLQKWIIFIDPIVLIVIVSPLIYLLIFKPLNQQAELMRAINSLEESEQHLQAVAQSANDAIISADSVGNIVDWNDAAERLFGYAKIEMIGQPITRLMPERFRNLHRDGMARVVAGGAPHVIGKTVELAGLHKDGSEFPLEFSLAQWRAADGQFFTAIIRDITERKLREEELWKSKDLLQAIVDNIPIWVFWKDRDSRFLGCNILFSKNAGLTHPDEIIGKTDFEMVWWKEAELYRADDKSVMNSGMPKLGYEEQQTTPDGNTIWVRTSKTLLHDIEGKAIGILGICEDITERKRTEAQLVEQLDELRRWQAATSGREGRILDLKHEINALLGQAGQPPRYPSAEP